MIEYILNDLYKSDNEWSISILRYFNPVGSHESGLIGENPNGIPNNLMPDIVKVAMKEYDHLDVFGNDYNTEDGTGFRDYVHVTDLAMGHVCVSEYVMNNRGLDVFNLGTGKGYSVLELIKTFEEENCLDVPYVVSPRRDGDIDACYADASYVKEKLNWEAKIDLGQMCKDAHNYIIKNK